MGNREGRSHCLRRELYPPPDETSRRHDWRDCHRRVRVEAERRMVEDLRARIRPFRARCRWQPRAIHYRALLGLFKAAKRQLARISRLACALECLAEHRGWI